jgi:UDP-N-acetylmuramoyl-tripeptide--D-alanyl-D-alanine ligase
MRLSLAEIAAAARGTVRGNDRAVVSGFANDSRSIVEGECFVAIVNQRDGHEFVGHAFDRGAGAAIVARLHEAVPAVADLVVVDDPVEALARIARWARTERLSSTRVVGITGSTGKTSTKDLLAGALGSSRRVHANRASFNNEIGLPITVLGASDDIDVLVCEMGARFSGNIADLCEIAQPQIGVITNIGVAHSEHIGGLESVRRVKAELLGALPASGLAVLNRDDASTAKLAVSTRARVVTVGLEPGADVQVRVLGLSSDLRATVAIHSPWGYIETELGLRGAHQAANAALAAAVALSEGIGPDQVAVGLSVARGSSLRMDLAHTVEGITVLNDSYNANPQSMRAALLALRDLPVAGRRVAVLGPMREIGPTSDAEHAAIGALTADCGVQRLVAVGESADIALLARAAENRGVEVVAVEDPVAVIDVLGDLIAGDAVLIKASRTVGLEVVARALLAQAPFDREVTGQ